jgi:transposase
MCTNVMWIDLEFGVSYHPRHVGRLCQVIRWSPQKPTLRARQRDEAAIPQWRQETWAALKKGRRRSSRPSSLYRGYAEAVR